MAKPPFLQAPAGGAAPAAPMPFPKKKMKGKGKKPSFPPKKKSGGAPSRFAKVFD